MVTLEERLADMDRRLRDMQAELAPARGTRDRANDARAAAAPRERSGPLAEVLRRGPRREAERPSSRQLDAAAELSARLLASMRELLDGYETVLAQMRPERRRPPAVTVSAGPFTTTTALKEFERALSGLPGVRGVALRGYEGPDRAIIEVQLS